MAYRVILERPVSRAIGSFGLSRSLLIRLLTRLHSGLPQQADSFRSQRDPEDPDLFRYEVVLAEGNAWHTFRFHINDTRAQGFLFVEAVAHNSNPANP